MTAELFTSRFNQADWTALCAIPQFNEAVAAEDFALAEVIAWRQLTNNLNTPVNDWTEVGKIERLHLACREFVAVWARRTGREGRGGKQSRQNHIRKLMKRGLNSDFARKMCLEAGIVAG